MNPSERPGSDFGSDGRGFESLRARQNSLVEYWHMRASSGHHWPTNRNLGGSGRPWLRYMSPYRRARDRSNSSHPQEAEWRTRMRWQAICRCSAASTSAEHSARSASTRCSKSVGDVYRPRPTSAATGMGGSELRSPQGGSSERAFSRLEHPRWAQPARSRSGEADCAPRNPGTSLAVVSRLPGLLSADLGIWPDPHPGFLICQHISPRRPPCGRRIR